MRVVVIVDSVGDEFVTDHINASSAKHRIPIGMVIVMMGVDREPDRLPGREVFYLFEQ